MFIFFSFDYFLCCLKFIGGSDQPIRGSYPAREPQLDHTGAEIVLRKKQAF